MVFFFDRVFGCMIRDLLNICISKKIDIYTYIYVFLQNFEISEKCASKMIASDTLSDISSITLSDIFSDISF